MSIIEELCGMLKGGCWNYRFIQRTSDTPYGTEVWYELYEVYYDGAGDVIGITANPVTLWCENKKDMKDCMKMYKRALKRTYLIRLCEGEYIDSGRKIPRKYDEFFKRYKVATVKVDETKGDSLEEQINKYCKQGYKLHSVVETKSFDKYRGTYKVILERKDICQELGLD